jgi:hypothetical protein
MKTPRRRTLLPEDESQDYGERGGGRPMLLRASEWETEDNCHRADDFPGAGPYATRQAIAEQAIDAYLSCVYTQILQHRGLEDVWVQDVTFCCT